VSFESALLLLVLVMDPFGNIPFFVAALNQVDPSRHRKIVIRELLIAFAVMLVFLFLGRRLLHLMGVSGPALTLAGGVILFLIALRMVFPLRDRSYHEQIEGEPFIVPLAVPYVAGPSLLAAELMLVSREPDRWPLWLLAVTVAWLITAVIVLLGSRVSGFLGNKGLIAIERLMGMMLVAIATQMLLNGLDEYLA
jgi:MarC family membrane protein